MRRWIALVTLVTLSLSLATHAALAAGLEVIRDEPQIDEARPSRSDGYLAWSQFDRETLRTNSYVMADGGDPVRINPIGTRSSGAVIDGRIVAYEQTRHGDTDIRFYDAVGQQHWDAPEGVNTPAQEMVPALSGEWLLFRRTNANRVPFGKAYSRLFLLNLDTLERRRLVDSQASQRYTVPDQVNGDWVTYESCAFKDFVFTNCQVFLYRISTGTRTRLPNPGVQQYAGGVTSDGTVYLIRSGNQSSWLCGANTRIVRVPFGDDPAIIARLADNVDVLSSFVFEDAYDAVTFYLERLRCGTGAGGIYAIQNADTASVEG